MPDELDRNNMNQRLPPNSKPRCCGRSLEGSITREPVAGKLYIRDGGRRRVTGVLG